jgi:nitric oxide reductase NorQ protein
MTPSDSPQRSAFREKGSPPSFYKESRNEKEVFRAAFSARVPLLLTGPTGCGKTRLVEHMADLLERPLFTISCHDDLTSSDLVGRFLVHGGDVEWIDGPLTRAVRGGALCYLDEVIEARRDTLAVLHSLTDHRRSLYLDRINERVPAAEGFMLVCSYNPASRSALKELKASFRQRFVSVDLDYLPEHDEVSVVVAETGVNDPVAHQLVHVAIALRNAAHEGTHEPPSTRTLVTAARLVVEGLAPRAAIHAAILEPLFSGNVADTALRELIAALLPD